MKNGVISQFNLKLFDCEVAVAPGQVPEFKPGQLFRFRDPLDNIQRTIMADITAGNAGKIADFACHPEHALHLWLAGYLSGDDLAFHSVETEDSITVEMATLIPRVPKIKLVILSPKAFALLGLPRRASGATRDVNGEVL